LERERLPMFIKAGLQGCIADEQAWRRRQEGRV
jgi:hypothetical protein